VAKTRAQRKAERRAREAQQRQMGQEPGSEEQAQHDTQVPISGDVAEVTAVEVGMGANAPEADLEVPDAPAPARPTKPSRADRRAAQRARKEQEKQERAEQDRKERDRIARKEKQAAEDRQRGRVIGFIASCWAELKKVQWPDRDTLVQASAVTLVFVAIAAAYLGALDAFFSWMVDRIL
jgi:preprotein translocase subunit SecE